MKERYRAIKLIGQGSFGRTFLAIDEDMPSKPSCVIKQFFYQGKDSEKAEELFRQEAVQLEKLGEHPQVPQLMAHFELDSGLYLVEEFIEGKNLLEELKEDGAFDESKINQLLNNLLPVLEFIHKNQVIHRDIKPENIIRRQVEGNLVLVDFGASKFATETALGKTGTVIGTQGYAAPEQSQGKVYFSSDLYALGRTCFHLLTANHPSKVFSQWGNWQKYLRINLDNSGISNELKILLTKLLNPDINQRYQSAEEVLKNIVVKEKFSNCEIDYSKHYQSSFSSNIYSFRQSSPDAISSSLGIDYSQLEKLLAMEKWKDADELTTSFTIEMMSKLPINMLPCQDIRTIDRLWGQYSSKRFSFSVQNRIWQSITKIKYTPYETCCRFMEYVGWNKPYSDHQLYFTPDAPEGHLPASVWLLFWRNYQHLGMDKAISRWFELFSCIDSCGL